MYYIDTFFSFDPWSRVILISIGIWAVSPILLLLYVFRLKDKNREQSDLIDLYEAVHEEGSPIRPFNHTMFEFVLSDVANRFPTGKMSEEVRRLVRAVAGFACARTLRHACFKNTVEADAQERIESLAGRRAIAEIEVVQSPKASHMTGAQRVLGMTRRLEQLEVDRVDWSVASRGTVGCSDLASDIAKKLQAVEAQ